MGLLSRRAHEMHEPPAGSAPLGHPASYNAVEPRPNNTATVNDADPNAQQGLVHQQIPPSQTNRGLFGRARNHDRAIGTGSSNPVNNARIHTGPAPVLNANSQSSPRTSRETGSSAHSGTQHTLIEEGKLRRKGKMENTMGTLFCNSNMKRKSEAHLAQADHLKMQASELGEAERLEAEAGMRRQRAVGLGADPAQTTGQTGYAQRVAGM